MTSARTSRRMLAACAAACAVALTGCNESPTDSRNDGPLVLVYGTIDSVHFWPPNLHYARTHDTLVLLARNLSRVHSCAEPLENAEAGWRFESHPTGDIHRFRTPLSVKPQNVTCPPDPGRDTSFRFSYPTPAGRMLYLQTPDMVTGDSVRFLGGEVSLLTFEHVRTSDEDTLSTHGRFVFRDSTAGHPRRMIHTDSLATCEVFQAASYTRNDDTLSVRMRLILADSLDAGILPACAGPRADTLEIFPRLYRFP